MFNKGLNVPLLPWQMVDMTARELIRMDNMLEDMADAGG